MPITLPAANQPPVAATIVSQDVRNELSYIDDWVRAHGVSILIAVGAGVAIYFALSILRGYVRRAAARQAQQQGVLATTLRVLARTGHRFMIITAIRLVAGFASPPDVVMQVIQVIFIIVFALQMAVWCRELVLDVMRGYAAKGGYETLGNAMSLINVLVSVTVFSVALIVILDNLGVNVTGLVAGLGIGGIAIGLAAQGIFSDLFASLSIIFDRPFRIGDAIAFDTTTATVERIGLKSTRLRSVNGQQVIISNTNLLGKEISNFSRLKHRRMSFALGLVYQTSPADLRAVPTLLEQITTEFGHQFVRAGFINFGNSSLDFEYLIDVATDDMAVLQKARNDIGIRLYELFTQRGLEFAYPTQTTFTAAPDGSAVMPYLVPDAPKPAPAPGAATVLAKKGQGGGG